MSKTRQCRHCHRDYDPYTKKKGYIYECDQCAEDDTIRHIGRPTGSSKGAQTEIFRGVHAIYAESVLKRENRIGPTANLPVGNPAVQQKIDGKKEEEER